MDIKQCDECKGSGVVTVLCTEYPHSWQEDCNCYTCKGFGFLIDDQSVDDFYEYLSSFYEGGYWSDGAIY